MIVVTYIYIMLIVIAITSIRLDNNKLQYIKITDNRHKHSGSNIDNSVPLIKATIITIILSLHSAYLGISGKLIDTSRYAWSFLFRYPQYYDSFDTFFKAKTEPGFLFLNMLVIKVTDNPFWLFFLIAVVTTFINVYCMFRLNTKYVILMITYLISIYYFQSMYILRQTIAVSFANLAYIAMLNDKKSKYFLFSFLGLTFHSTAIILFPMFYIYKQNNFKKKYFFLFASFFGVFFLFGPIIASIIQNFPFINQYIDVQTLHLTTGGGSFSSVFKGIPYYIITILSFLKRKELKRNLANADFFILSSLFYTMSWLLTYNLYWSFRIGWYFLLPTIVLVPNLLGVVNNKYEKMLYSILIYLFFLIITFRQIAITIF